MSQNIQAIYPLTPIQEGILFHAIEKPQSDSYFLQFACTIEGELDIPLWQQSWDQLAQMHDMLRTLFTWKGRPHPLQVVRNYVELDWILLDWRHKSACEQAQKWEGFMATDRDLGFNFEKAPLMRFALVQVSDLEFRFLLSFHHVAYDGWSQRLLMDQALKNYHALVTKIAGETNVKPRRSFADFAEHFKRFNEKTAESFWTQYLQGFTETTSISSGNAASNLSANETIKGAVHRTLDHKASEALYAKARESGLTVNTMILGAWSLVLSTHCDRDDIVFGTTVSGRPVDLIDADKIVGLFINTLPVRATISPDLGLEQWLKAFQDSQISARAYEQTPLPLIQNCSEIKPAQSLFDSIVVVESFAQDDDSGSINDKSPSPIVLKDPVYTEFSHYPLAILVEPSIHLSLTAVFQESGIRQELAEDLLARLVTVLIGMSETLNQPLVTLQTAQKTSPATLESERPVQMSTKRQQPCFRYLEQLAEQSANTLAIVDLNQSPQETRLSYRALNEQANRLAHLLLSKGVSKGHIVPILLERSFLCIVSLFAVSKCGAAYVLLDPELTVSRLQKMLSTLGQQTTLVISSSDLAQKVMLDHVDLLLIDEQDQALFSRSTENPNISVTPESLAYVIYTSGTTGIPKGVKTSHRALSHSTLARALYYDKPPAVFMHLSSLSTDSAIAGLYWTLCFGGTLLLAAKHAEQDCRSLGEDIRKYSVSHTLCIPSLYKLILENARLGDLKGIDSVVLAGETCPKHLVLEHNRLLSSIRLFNEYGPSEYCVWASAEELTSYTSENPISIGNLIANTHGYVLDEEQNTVGAGQIGELYLCGDNIADGYINDLGKTEQVFVDNPFYSNFESASTDAESECSSHRNQPDGKNSHLNKSHLKKMYRTGDRVRQLVDGRYVFEGRADHQLKVRGFRIEPEEVEEALTEHEDIVEALVYLQPKQNSDEKLVEALVEMGLQDAQRLLMQIEFHESKD